MSECPIFLNIEAKIGSDIVDVVEKAKDIAMRLDVNVKVEINNITVYVYKNSDINVVLAWYRHDLQEANK